MKPRYQHRPGLNVQAHFATENGRHFRYTLVVSRGASTTDGRTICVVMQNPSYAGVDVADKSVQVLERVVFEQGRSEFAGVTRMVIVNLYAAIQTNDFRPAPAMIGSKNDVIIENSVETSDIVLIAWGQAKADPARKKWIVRLAAKYPGKHWLKTRMHPARVRYKGFIQPLNTS